METGAAKVISRLLLPLRRLLRRSIGVVGNESPPVDDQDAIAQGLHLLHDVGTEDDRLLPAEFA